MKNEKMTRVESKTASSESTSQPLYQMRNQSNPFIQQPKPFQSNKIESQTMEILQALQNFTCLFLA